MSVVSSRTPSIASPPRLYDDDDEEEEEEEEEEDEDDDDNDDEGDAAALSSLRGRLRFGSSSHFPVSALKT